MPQSIGAKSMQYRESGFLPPNVPGPHSAVAQFRNKDRIKLCTKTVQVSTTHTNYETSEGTLHSLPRRNSQASGTTTP
jgi:hypothetical protein